MTTTSEKKPKNSTDQTSVDEDNVGAQRLYERLGWSEVHRLTSMRRAGPPSSRAGTEGGP